MLAYDRLASQQRRNDGKDRGSSDVHDVRFANQAAQL